MIIYVRFKFASCNRYSTYPSFQEAIGETVEIVK